MKILPMPADWTAEHTADAAFRRAIIDAFRVSSHLLYPPWPGMIVIINPDMPEGSMSLVAGDGTTVRISNIGKGDI